MGVVTLDKQIEEHKDFLKIFINDPNNQVLLERNDFEGLYSSIKYKYKYNGEIEAFTALLLKSNINFLSYIKETPNYCFDHLDIEYVDLPENLEVLGRSTFRGCENLKLSKLPSSLKEIGEACFQDCDNIIKLEIPEGVGAIDNFAFEACTNLEEIYFPNTLDYLGDSILSKCNKLKKIYFNDTKDNIIYLLGLNEDATDERIILALYGTIDLSKLKIYPKLIFRG